MTRRGGVAAIALSAVVLAGGREAAAQSYRLRIESRGQSVSYRGLAADSIPVAETVVGPTGGLRTPTGYAVQCRSTPTYCDFYRPGPVRHTLPMVSSADLVMWGLGVAGLSVHLSSRFGFDLADSASWPGTFPGAQILLGYAEYATSAIGVRLGRQQVASRLGFQGYDGGRVTLRAPGRGVDLTGYAGWGLAWGAALPVTSPALNPLDDFQPRQRHWLLGAQMGVSRALGALRAVYEREFDPGPNYVVSERLGADGSVTLGSVSVGGGADYDLAFGEWGSAEGSVTFVPRRSRVSVAAGARRYRPHFDLWTIWGVFSPTPYNAAFATLDAGPIARRVQVRGRAERYWYESAAAETPLVTGVEDGGWRWSLGASVTMTREFALDAGYHLEHGPGAASGGVEGSLSWSPRAALMVSGFGMWLDRPLEFRYNDATVWAAGAEVDCRPHSRVQVGVSAGRYAQSNDRPDAAAVDWNQWRLSARLSLLVGSEPGRDDVPPAVRRMPAGRRGP